ncbi:outer membrane beta-barrel protein [Chitinophaga sp. 30R24]|uniref:outer membrane beta-barrel protein n=1 Tax=Chitinophaga sp. 30R24 TaxID=3248838 RepID=UPI003B8ED6CB
MKRLFLICSAALMAAAVTTQAQDDSHASSPHSKFYFKVAGGYFFSVSPGQFPNVGPYPPQDLHTEVNPVTGIADTISRKVLTGSYGEGFRVGLSFGYNINRYMAIEGTFNYFHSSKNLMTRQLTTVVGAPSQQLGDITSHGYVYAVDFAPSLVVSPGLERVNPYVRIGVVFPLWGRLYIKTEADQLSAPPAGLPVPPGSLIATDVSRKEAVKPNITLGYQGALGVSFRIASHFDIFVEAEYRNVPVKSKDKDVVRYAETNTLVSAAGAPIQVVSTRSLDQLSTAEKDTKYVTTLTQNSNTPINQIGTTVVYKNNNIPANDIKSYINIGGLGVNVGLKIRL